MIGSKAPRQRYLQPKAIQSEEKRVKCVNRCHQGNVDERPPKSIGTCFGIKKYQKYFETAKCRFEDFWATKKKVTLEKVDLRD